MFVINPQFKNVRIPPSEKSTIDYLLSLCKFRHDLYEDARKLIHRTECRHYFDYGGNIIIESFAEESVIKAYIKKLVEDGVITKDGKRTDWQWDWKIEKTEPSVYEDTDIYRLSLNGIPRWRFSSEEDARDFSAWYQTKHTKED